MLLLPLSRHFLLGSAMYVERLLGLENLGVLTWSNLGVLTQPPVSLLKTGTQVTLHLVLPYLFLGLGLNCKPIVLCAFCFITRRGP